MKVIDIVKDWLRAHGYDGLYSDECICRIDDLAPCGGEGMSECRAGSERLYRINRLKRQNMGVGKYATKLKGLYEREKQRADEYEEEIKWYKHILRREDICFNCGKNEASRFCKCEHKGGDIPDDKPFDDIIRNARGCDAPLPNKRGFA